MLLPSADVGPSREPAPQVDHSLARATIQHKLSCRRLLVSGIDLSGHRDIRAVTGGVEVPISGFRPSNANSGDIRENSGKFFNGFGQPFGDVHCTVILEPQSVNALMKLHRVRLGKFVRLARWIPQGPQ